MADPVGELVTPVLERIDGVLGQGYSAVLYGSAARGEYREKVSDVNLLLVCEELGPGTLRRLSESLVALRRERQAPPLLVERGEWEAAADVFPIEITDMQVARTLLRGTDPVSSMTVDHADLRRALEAEFRAKLLRLRQAYAFEATHPRSLGRVASGTVASVAALFRVAGALYGEAPVARTPAALRAAGGAMGIPIEPVIELWTRRTAEGPPCSAELFEEYLSAVGSAVRVIDTFTHGES